MILYRGWPLREWAGQWQHVIMRSPDGDVWPPHCSLIPWLSCHESWPLSGGTGLITPGKIDLKCIIKNTRAGLFVKPCVLQNWNIKFYNWLMVAVAGSGGQARERGDLTLVLQKRDTSILKLLHCALFNWEKSGTWNFWIQKWGALQVSKSRLCLNLLGQ